MKHIIKPGMALLSLLAAILFCGTLISSAQSPAPPATFEQHSIYLPVIARPRTGTTPPPPTPPPVEHAGFFALREALTYNAATAVDGSGVHLAFYFSDEGQGVRPSQPAALRPARAHLAGRHPQRHVRQPRPAGGRLRCQECGGLPLRPGARQTTRL